jgi:hypothetical protein
MVVQSLEQITLDLPEPVELFPLNDYDIVILNLSGGANLTVLEKAAKGAMEKVLPLDDPMLPRWIEMSLSKSSPPRIF